MSASRRLGVLAVLVAVAAVLASVPPASAHQERASQFPPGTGRTPVYRPFAESTPRLVVCKVDSAARIAAITDPDVRAFNERLVDDCGFEHIQAAVDAVEVRGTNIYVLPGVYREEPSHAPPCTEGYDGGVVDYDLTVSCGEVVNLVTVAGDDPADPDIVCDGARCDLQIEGTGARPDDVVLRGGFDESGDWIKHNGIKADRADGFYLRNIAFELFRENAVYVHETDGYVVDRVIARHNDLYGILTFTSDHGLIKDCETSYNGDSGVYPGSAADVNKDSESAVPPITRWAVEITGCDTHHNALGFSGTAGNSVFFHDNRVHHNGAGYVTDSFVGGHPGMPQDHARLEHNLIYANNSNYFAEFVHSGVCARKPAERGYGTGTVCPVFPVPVGTGVLIAGGNYNLVRDNDVYDNWRNGVMQFWIPGAIRGDYDPAAQLGTSNGNRYIGNRMARHPSGATQPNGLDFWWDDQGVGNCWEGNTSAAGAVTHNALLPLPDCGTGSLVPVGNVKDATLLPCAEYNREDNPDPVGCDWLDSPAEPAGREAAPDDDSAAGVAPAGAVAGSGGGAARALPAAAPAPGGELPVTGRPMRLAATGTALVALALAVHALRRRRPAP